MRISSRPTLRRKFTIVEAILTLIICSLVIILANVLVIRGSKTEQRIFNWALFLLNTPIFFFGLFLLVIPTDIMDEVAAQAEIGFGNSKGMGLSLVMMAGWGLLVTLPPVRRLMGRLMQIDPASPVHTLALVMVGYLVGQTWLVLTQGGLEGLAEIAEPTSIDIIVVNELVFVAAALLGVGFLVRRHGRELRQRLGLVKPEPKHLLVGVALIGVLVVLQTIVSLVWSAFNPDQAAVLEDLNTILLADMDTLAEWFILALSAGFAEELLFRGALQPVMGLGFTAVVFALIHVQYGFSPILLFIVFLAVILGLVRRYYNTTTAIFIHVGYNFVLGLLALLASYLEPFAG